MLTIIKKFLNLNFYTSELDQFLRDYQKSHPTLSTTQRAEVARQERVAKLRDHANVATNSKKNWEQF